MVLKNNSSKIIGIGGISFLPGESTECPKAYEKNPVVRKYMSNGIFTEIKPEKKGSSTQKSDPVKTTDPAKTGDPGSAPGLDDAGKQADAK